jgi:hypothetical protein
MELALNIWCLTIVLEKQHTGRFLAVDGVGFSDGVIWEGGQAGNSENLDGNIVSHE